MRQKYWQAWTKKVRGERIRWQSEAKTKVNSCHHQKTLVKDENIIWDSFKGWLSNLMEWIATTCNIFHCLRFLRLVEDAQIHKTVGCGWVAEVIYLLTGCLTFPTMWKPGLLLDYKLMNKNPNEIFSQIAKLMTNAFCKLSQYIDHYLLHCCMDSVYVDSLHLLLKIGLLFFKVQ